MKDFILLGTLNVCGYKEVFPLLRDDKVRLGYSKIKTFWTRTGTKDFGNVGWYTTLPVEKKTLTLTSTYDPDKYPKYDNYDAIEVSKVAEIPMDYDGVMGVPISFLDKYCPTQFEIVDAVNRYTLCDYFNVNEEVRKKHSHCANINGKAVYSRILIRKRNA